MTLNYHKVTPVGKRKKSSILNLGGLRDFPHPPIDQYKEQKNSKEGRKEENKDKNVKRTKEEERGRKRQRTSPPMEDRRKRQTRMTDFLKKGDPDRSRVKEIVKALEKGKEPNEEKEKDKDRKGTKSDETKRNREEEREKKMKRMDKWWRERKTIIEERNKRKMIKDTKEQQEKQERQGEHKEEREPATKSREKGTHTGPPMMRVREHWGKVEEYGREKETTITRKKHEDQRTTKHTPRADATHTHKSPQVHPHHPPQGPEDRRSEGKGEHRDGVRKEGHKGRLEPVRRSRKRKQSPEQTTPPKLRTEWDEMTGPGTGHPPTQSPKGNSGDELNIT